METHPKVLGFTLDPTHILHTHSQHLSTRTQTFTNNKSKWAKQRETLMATYKAVIRQALEYASSIWSPLASSTNINKLQVMQNAALRTTTGCTQDTNIQHLHDETLILPIHEHLQFHASQCIQKTQHPSHSLHKHNLFQHSRATNTQQPALHAKHSHRPPHSHCNEEVIQQQHQVSLSYLFEQYSLYSFNRTSWSGGWIMA